MNLRGGHKNSLFTCGGHFLLTQVRIGLKQNLAGPVYRVGTVQMTSIHTPHTRLKLQTTPPALDSDYSPHPPH